MIPAEAAEVLSMLRTGATKLRGTSSWACREGVERGKLGWLTLAHTPGVTCGKACHLSASAGDINEKTSTRPQRTYLERWAGIRDGMSSRSEAAVPGESYFFAS